MAKGSVALISVRKRNKNRYMNVCIWDYNYNLSYLPFVFSFTNSFIYHIINYSLPDHTSSRII